MTSREVTEVIPCDACGNHIRINGPTLRAEVAELTEKAHENYRLYEEAEKKLEEAVKDIKSLVEALEGWQGPTTDPKDVSYQEQNRTLIEEINKRYGLEKTEDG